MYSMFKLCSNSGLAPPRISTMSRHSLEDIGLNRDEIFLGHAETFWRI
jgi:hypothetical protein